jgi:diguanylate cyclase (GGDEF)-like protein
VATAVQPIVRLEDHVTVGYEALARVSVDPALGPLWWLERADEMGMRARLEVLFLESVADLSPPPDDALLFVNASPVALADPALFALRSSLPERLVLEVTEQAAVDDYDVLKAHLEPWTASRARLAIDDTGAGFSSLRHVVELSPDFLKLDRTLVQEVDKDSTRQALIRALVAFAREVGTSVIAEGVETAGELAALVAAEVPLAQGYLLGRPGPAWPASTPRVRSGHPRSHLDPHADLRESLSKASDARQAGEVVVSHLFRQGQVMPSLYLERNGRLRCVAQRGLWQVLDGLAPDRGITGRAWASGQAIVVDDVASSGEYMAAIPGIVAEICVPIKVEGSVVGALNIDSLSRLPSGALGMLEACASLLSARIESLGWRHHESPWQRAVHESLAISQLATNDDAPAQILGALLAASRMDSAALVLAEGGHPEVTAATGPLAASLRAIDEAHLVSLCSLVDRLSSCYTGQEQTGLAYAGNETIRAAGARAVVLLPLRANNANLGTIILAHSRPMRLGADLVEPLELLAGQAAAALNAVDLFDRLRAQAQYDSLTGLQNRQAFEHALQAAAESRPAVLIADLDHFKQVNDVRGHLAGDEALRALGSELRSELGDTPFYRFGGDEFTCLLPGYEHDRAWLAAQTVAEMARKVLAPWHLSASIGVAVPLPEESCRDTLARADAALLWTKRHAPGEAAIASPETCLAPLNTVAPLY